MQRQVVIWGLLQVTKMTLDEREKKTYKMKNNEKEASHEEKKKILLKVIIKLSWAAA